MIDSEFSASTQEQRNYTESSSKKKTKAFGVLLIISQIAICVLYGLLVQIPERAPTPSLTYFVPILFTFFIYFFVIVGFGMFFAYERRLVWSAIGFNLLITCLTIQWYFLYFFFWRNTGMLYENQNFNQTRQQNLITLTNADEPNLTPALLAAGNLSMALRAALANCVAFSFILGKAGPLEAFFLSFLGTFGFQLNRQVIHLLEQDYGYTYTVFVYGAFLGLLMSVMIGCKYKKQKDTGKHPYYVGSPFSGSMSSVGACIVFCFFPILAMETHMSITKGQYALHALYRIPLSVWYTISATVIFSVIGSIFVHGKPLIRDLINSVVAGGVCSLTASFYLTSPIWSILLGCLAGIVQTVGHSIIENRSAKEKSVLATHSFTIFGIQGIIGGIWAAIFRRVLEVEMRRQGFIFPLALMSEAGWSLLIAIISAGIAVIFGLFIGIIMMIMAKHLRMEHFHDYTYWVPDDGIRYDLEYESSYPSSGTSIGEYHVHEVNDNIKSHNAYL